MSAELDLIQADVDAMNATLDAANEDIEAIKAIIAGGISAKDAADVVVKLDALKERLGSTATQLDSLNPSEPGGSVTP